MLELLDSLNYDMDAATRATSPTDRAHHCLRIEVAALQLSQLLDSKYPNVYAGHLTVLLDGAFAFVQEMNGD